MKKILSFALSVGVVLGAALLPAGVREAHAGAAPAYAEGFPSTEPYVSGAEHVKVEREKLVFHAEKLPEPWAEDYTGTVRAEYALYNPSDEDETLSLSVPLGTTENYYYDYGNRKDVSCDVTVDGEAVEYHLRHSYDVYGSYAGDGEPEFLRADTVLHGYTYTVRLPEGSADRSYSFALETHYDVRATKPISPDLRTQYVGNGNQILEMYLDPAYSCTVLFAGDDAVKLSFRVLCGNDETVLDGAEITERSFEKTFSEYVGDSPYEEVSADDWLNCVASYWETTSGNASVPEYRELSRQAVCDFTVPAGGRVTLAVETPLLPSMRSSSCYCTYSFSGALGWAEYGGLDIEVYAESAPLNSSLELTAGDGVYTHSRGNIPMGDFRFTLGSGETYDYGYEGLGDLETALIIIAVVAAVAGITVVIAVRVRRKRVKALQERAEQDAQMKYGAERSRSDENMKKGD